MWHFTCPVEYGLSLSLECTRWIDPLYCTYTTACLFFLKITFLDTLDSFWNVGFLLGAKSTPTSLTCLTMQAIAIANGDWSTCNSRHLTTAVRKSTMRDKLKNNINHIIQHQNSQVINKILAGKKQNAKKLKSVQSVLDNLDPAWAKMKSNPASDPKKSHNSAGSESKNRIRNNTGVGRR